jgi:hypothetical protein
MRRRAGKNDLPHWRTLLNIARAADPDHWRNLVRDALERNDRKTLEVLAAKVPIRELSPGTLHAMAIALRDLGVPEQAATLLRQARLQYPDDLWINDELGWLAFSVFKNYDDAVRFYSVAQSLRPRSQYHSSNLRLVHAIRAESLP